MRAVAKTASGAVLLAVTGLAGSTGFILWILLVY
jgi:hypothetical protein